MEYYFKIKYIKGTDNARIDILNIIDFIYQIVQVLKEDLERLAVSIQDAGLMEPVEL